MGCIGIEDYLGLFALDFKNKIEDTGTTTWVERRRCYRIEQPQETYY